MKWPTVKFADAPLAIIDGDRGKNYPNQTELHDDGFCLFLNTGNVTPNGFKFDSCQYITEDKDNILRKGKLLRNDIVMTTRGTIGNVAYFHNDINFTHIRLNSGMVILRANEDYLSASYLYQYLRSDNFKSIVNQLRSGAAQPQLPIRDMKTIGIPLPPLPIQQKLAEILSAYDDLLENNRRRIRLLEKSAQLLYKEWFVNLRFPGHEHTKIVNGIPQGWTREFVGSLLTLQRGFDLPTQARVDGQFPIYASTGINGFHKEAKAKGPGVVTGRSGSLGTVIYVQNDYWPLNTTLWVKEFKKITPIFTTHLLRSLQLERYNGGAAVPTLNRNDVHKIEVLCPPQKLIQLFEDSIGDNYIQIDVLKKYNVRLEMARDILLPRLMNGNIEV